MTDSALLSKLYAERSDRLGGSEVARINAATSALSQIHAAPEMSNEQFAKAYPAMLAEARALADELNKTLTFTNYNWSGQGEQPLILWHGPEYVGSSTYEAIGSIREILPKLRADVARKRSTDQLIEASEAQRQRDREQIEEGRRASARQVLAASGYADELAAARSENAALRQELDQLRSLLLAQQPQQESAVTSAPGDESSPVTLPDEQDPAVVVVEAADQHDEFSAVAALKAAQAAVLSRFRS